MVLILMLIFPLEGASVELETDLIEELGVLGERIGSWLRDVGIGRPIDKVAVEQAREDLTLLRRDVEGRSPSHTQESRRIDVQLTAIQSELAALRALSIEKPSREELNRLRTEMEEALESLTATHLEHERRLQDHEERLAALEATTSLPGHWSHTPARERNSPQISIRVAHRVGAPTIMRVIGSSAVIQVIETPRLRSGSVRWSRSENRINFYLNPFDGGVVHLEGNDNLVLLPDRACGRLRVLDRGTDNQIEGCR